MRDTARQKAPTTRPHRIDTRLDADELRRVRKVAAWRGLAPSSFVREATMATVRAAEGQVPRRAEVGPSAPADGPVGRSSEELVELHAGRVALNRVGGNLNQLVRLANRGEIDLEELRPVVDELRGTIDELVLLMGGSRTP